MHQPMQQLVFEAPGILRWQEAAPPTRKDPSEVLVRPLVVASCDLDRQIVRGEAPFEPPFALGHEFVAEIVEVGEASRWRVGERVAVSYQPSCGQCRMCRRGTTAACREVPPTSMYGLGKAGGDWGGALSDCVRVPYPDAMLCPIPDGVSPRQAAHASDNLMDAWRCVAPPLERIPGGSVLVAGAWGISLFVVDCARRLGAERISYFSRDRMHLERAEALGAEVHEVDEWPRRFPNHDITVDVTGSIEGLRAVVSSTQAGGFCTVPAMYFQDVPLPMTRMYMKGITLCTGRTNGAADLPHMLELIRLGRIDPLAIGPQIVAWEQAGEALLGNEPKIIAERPTAA